MWGLPKLLQRALLTPVWDYQQLLRLSCVVREDRNCDREIDIDSKVLFLALLIPVAAAAGSDETGSADTAPFALLMHLKDSSQ
mmetsp:Transcript_6841/g.11404  ORF Transcript_6841/g.11404 Transcript_6841/m.11404 type:complete len:83 (-) Transcript_6841:29-277(-)